jgi:hypothetical protein
MPILNIQEFKRKQEEEYQQALKEQSEFDALKSFGNELRAITNRVYHDAFALIPVEIDGLKWWFDNVEWKIYENITREGKFKYVANLEDCEKEQILRVISPR